MTCWLHSKTKFRDKIKSMIAADYHFFVCFQMKPLFKREICIILMWNVLKSSPYLLLTA